jgi:hypothetical protein
MENKNNKNVRSLERRLKHLIWTNVELFENYCGGWDGKCSRIEQDYNWNKTSDSGSSKVFNDFSAWVVNRKQVVDEINSIKLTLQWDDTRLDKFIELTNNERTSNYLPEQQRCGETRDNKDRTVKQCGYASNKNKIRYPKKVRKTAWKRFYKLFPFLDPANQQTNN